MQTNQNCLTRGQINRSKYTMDQYPFLTHSKHIAFIGQKGIPAEFVGTSGIEFYVEYHAKRLVQQGKRVDCYVRNWATPSRATEFQGIRLIHIPTINTKHLDAAVHSFLSSIYVCFTNADTVWYQAIGPGFFSFIPKLFEKKIIFTSHALDWKRDKWGFFARWILRLVEYVAVHSADEIVVVSQELQEYYLKQYNKKSLIDTLKIEPTLKVKPNIITRKYGLKGNDYVLYMGRFVPEKRIEWLIEAYKEINPGGMKLVLSGGSSHTDEYENKLHTLAGKHKDIIFTGYVFGKEKQELLGNCRLFVLPSSLEGNPVVLHELPETTHVAVADNCPAIDYIKTEKVHAFRHNSKRAFIQLLNNTVKIANNAA